MNCNLPSIAYGQSTIPITPCISPQFSEIDFLALAMPNCSRFVRPEALSITGGTTAGLDTSLRHRFMDVHRRMKRYQGWMRSLPLVSAVKLIVDDLGLLAISAARPDGNPRSGRLLSALEALRERAHDFDHASDLIDFFERLPTLEESDSIPALTSDSDVVRLMNLHKSKGSKHPLYFLRMYRDELTRRTCTSTEAVMSLLAIWQSFGKSANSQSKTWHFPEDGNKWLRKSRVTWTQNRSG